MLNAVMKQSISGEINQYFHINPKQTNTIKLLSFAKYMYV